MRDSPKDRTYVGASDNVHPTSKSGIAIARLQGATGLVYGDDGRRAGGIDDDGRSSEPKRIRDLAAEESLQGTYGNTQHQTRSMTHALPRHLPVL